MRPSVVCVCLVSLATPLAAQVSAKWPPDSLINTQVIPRNTPVIQVVGQMRNITGALGVRCPFCHVGAEGKPLETFDFPNDEKRPKQVARQMMRMVQNINERLDTIPGRTNPGLQVTCVTCHRGVSHPVPLETLIQDAAVAGGADSAIRTYRALREEYYGRDAYDFGEPSLNIAAFRLGRERRFNEAFALLGLNEEMFPGSSPMYVFRGNISLMGGDTSAAADAFREAVRRDPENKDARDEALFRLRNIGRAP